ncbi:MAG: EutN/CcmL family microcompartment protein [Planctomycetaceae bacterium]
MRIGEIIGTVTLTEQHSSLTGASWKVVVPLMATGLRGEEAGRGEPFVVFDALGSGVGSLIAISEGGEAVAPFYPDVKPIDAYCSALLDTIDLEAETK